MTAMKRAAINNGQNRHDKKNWWQWMKHEEKMENYSVDIFFQPQFYIHKWKLCEMEA